MKIKSKSLKYGFVLLSFVFSLFYFTPHLLKHLALSLADSTHTTSKKTDAIVILAGDTGERVREASRLFHQQQAHLMIISGNNLYGVSIPEAMKNYAIHLQVPSENIIIESESESTLDHPKHLKPIFKAHNIKSILIVTSKFHTRRSYLTFKKVLKNENIDIFIAPAEDGINYGEWWKNHESAEKILLELGKTVWYYLE